MAGFVLASPSARNLLKSRDVPTLYGRRYGTGHLDVDHHRPGGRSHRQAHHAGRDPSGIIVTNLIGIAGSIVGGGLGAALLGTGAGAAGLIGSIIGALILLFLYQLVVGDAERCSSTLPQLCKTLSVDSTEGPGSVPGPSAFTYGAVVRSARNVGSIRRFIKPPDAGGMLMQGPIRRGSPDRNQTGCNFQVRVQHRRKLPLRLTAHVSDDGEARQFGDGEEVVPAVLRDAPPLHRLGEGAVLRGCLHFCSFALPQNALQRRVHGISMSLASGTGAHLERPARVHFPAENCATLLHAIQQLVEYLVLMFTSWLRRSGGPDPSSMLALGVPLHSPC